MIMLLRPSCTAIPILSLLATGCGSTHASATDFRYSARASTQVPGVGSANSRTSVDSPSFAPVRIKDDLFVYALNYATAQALDTLPGGRVQWIYVKLWALPAEGSGVEGTHLVCAFRYLLGVAPGGEGEGFGTVYDLGSVGQITAIEWLPRDS